MARKKIYINQLDLTNIQTPGNTIISIDTNMEGIAIGGATPGTGEFNVDALNGVNIRNTTLNPIQIQNVAPLGDTYVNANGILWLQAFKNDASAITMNATTGGINIDADIGIKIDNNTSGNIQITQNSSGQIIIYNSTSTSSAGIYIQSALSGMFLGVAGGSGNFDVLQSGTGALNLTSQGGGNIVITNTAAQINLSAYTDLSLGAITGQMGFTAQTNIAMSTVTGTIQILGFGNTTLGSIIGNTTVQASSGVSILNTISNSLLIMQSAVNADLDIYAQGLGSKIDMDADAGITIDNNTSGNIKINQSYSSTQYLEFDGTTNITTLRHLGSGLLIDYSGGAGATFNGQTAGLITFNYGGSSGLYFRENLAGSGGFQIVADGGGGGFLYTDSGVASGGFQVNLTGGGGSLLLQSDGGGSGVNITSNTIPGGTGSPLSIASGAGIQITNVGANVFLISQGVAQPFQIKNTVADLDIDAETGITIDNNTSGNIVITNSVSAGQIQLLANVGASEIDLTATTIDINGNADVSGTLTMGEIEIPTISGSDPADTPNAGTARYRTDTDVLWIYNGSAWKSVALS